MAEGLNLDTELFPGLAEEGICVCHGNWPECPLCHGTGRPCRRCGGLGVYLSESGELVWCDCRDVKRRAFLPAGLLRGMEDWTFASLRADGLRETAAKLRAWTESPGGWLLMVAPPGRGKSYLLACVVNHARSRGREAVYFITSVLLDEIQARRRGSPSFSDWSFPAWWRRLQEVELLVLDEFGNFNHTEAREEKLRELLVARSDPNYLPTVIASDRSFNQIEERYPWLASRLRHPKVRSVDFTGVPDLRRLMGKGLA